MFSFRGYIKEGFLKAVGQMSEYQIILNSASWCEKGVLKESDLAEIQDAINKRREKFTKKTLNETVSEEETEAE